MLDSASKPFRQAVENFEMLYKTDEDADLYPLFAHNPIDSYNGTVKINRIVQLQYHNLHITDPIKIHAVCYEILCLRQQARRSKEEHVKKERANSSKSMMANIGSLTVMIATLGGFLLSVYGPDKGKKA